MSFVSLSFFLFFPTVSILYFLLPQRFRWIWLLGASCLFYMAFIPAYIFVLLGLVCVDYTAGIMLERTEGPRRRHILLISILSTCGVLFVFKYFNFFNSNAAGIFSLLHWSYPIGFLSIALPIGLSFHTFQSLSYVIEVYRKKQKAEHHFGIYALYVMFYPQLVAGPIERPQQLLHQFYETHAFDYERIKLGLLRMLWGFFKKMVIADRLGQAVSIIYNQPAVHDGLSLIIASAFFVFQLYFDFSAYCDIALGAAQVMGFTLMENFNRPFTAKSMAEFWRRWHISLSSWFRDYFYYPLLLSQKKITPARMYAAILFTFLVTGFWHGANWTFGVFGALHGFYIVFGGVTQKLRQQFAGAIGLLSVPKIHRILQAITIFCLMTLTCIFFRAQTLSDGWYITTHLLSGISHIGSTAYLSGTLSDLGLSLEAFFFSLLLIAFVFWCEYLGREKGMFVWITGQSVYLRWVVYWAILYMTIAFSITVASQFIYFKF